MESKPKIFAASGSLPLAEKIAQAYGTKLGKVELSRFSDGEFQPCFEETVRGAHVYLAMFHSSAFGQPHGAPADDRLREEGFRE